MAGTRYIGKLAAILTVNNSDLAPKLSGSAKQVTSFARTVNSTISQATSSAAKSFNEIFTQTQKLGRALSVANRDPLNLNVDARKVEQLVLAANQLAKPLSAGVKGFSDLATSVQRQFDPALRQVQQSLKSVQAAIDANEAVGASTFQTLAADVGQTTAALSRLQERAAASSRLFRGTELTFVDPRGVDAINAVIAAQQRLANASSATRGSPIARDLIADAQILQEQYQRISARIERLNAEGLDITVSQAGLDRVIRDLETVARLTSEVAGGAQRGFRLAEAPREQRGLGLFGSAQGSAEEQAIARARQVSAEFARLPEAAQAGLRGLAGIASNVANSVEAGTSNAAQLNAVLDRLANRIAGVRATRRGQDNEIGALINRERTRLQQENERAAAARRAEDNEIAALISRERASLERERSAPTQLPADFGRNRLLGSIGGEIDVVRRRIEELPGVTAQVGPEVDRLTARFRNLASSGVGFTAEQAQRLRDEVAAVNASLNARQSQARQLESSFGGAGRAGINLGIDERAVRGIAAQFEFLQGRLAGVSAQARGPLVSAMQRYRQVAVQAFRDGSISTEQGQRRLENYRNEVVRVGAAILNVKPGRLADQLQRVGDVARGSFGNAGLAIQQAAFAIDDFFSVTGGLDQRIRAAGNNISQLGFILGGTTGLIAGIALSIGSQLVAALIRWYSEADKAEAATKRLNSALEQQKSKAEELAASYRQLAAAIQEAGLSEGDREFRRRRQPLEDIREQQAERRRAIAAANAPQTGGAQARIDAIDKELEQEENLLSRRRLLAERRREQAKIDAELSLIERQAASFAGTAVAFQPGLPAATRSLEQSRTETQRDLARAERRGDAGAVERLSRQLASLDVAIQDLRDRQVNRGFDRQQQVSDSFARAQSTLANVDGFRFADFIGTDLQDQLRTQLDSLAAGEINITDFEIATRAIVIWGERVESASSQVAAFAEAIGRAATELSRTVEGELSQRSDSLRRQANAAEAQFGADDPRTVALRSQQEAIESARRAATRNRQEIQLEESRRRREFEESALLGRGSLEAAAVGSRIAELQRLVATPATDQAGIDAREEARLEIDRLRSRLAEIFDARPGTQELRRRADEGDIAAQRQIQDIESQARGRQFSLTPAEQAAEELNTRIQDIRNYFSNAAENSTGLPADVAKIRNQMNAAIEQTTVDAARRVAPAIFALGEEVQNALLQGPSRAALGATDASTVEGQRELNRLLRGDDQARDVNLAELEKQSRLLEEIAKNTEGGAPVAI